MEDVLEAYTRPYDPKRPLVCLDELPVQLIGETRPPQAVQPGQPERCDYEYVRNGVANLFLLSQPLVGQREVVVTERRTGVDWAHCIQDLVDRRHAEAETVVLVMDQLNTHSPAWLYEAFPPAEARRLSQKLEIHSTPKHGSWLNMAEIELSVLARQCLNCRILDMATLESEVAAWQDKRNVCGGKVHWRFTTDDARIRLKRLYPSIED